MAVTYLLQGNISWQWSSSRFLFGNQLVDTFSFGQAAPFAAAAACFLPIVDFFELHSLVMCRGVSINNCCHLPSRKAIFLGNGLVAVLVGLFGNLLVNMFSFGRAAPFAAAAAFFLPVGMTYLLSSWTENYGDPSESKDLLTQSKGELLWPLLLAYFNLCPPIINMRPQYIPEEASNTITNFFLPQKNRHL
ncbi:hypothetical protein RHGRI_006092 [Rhododendron griersonianum]|uniref:Uncharacterized protein n=1 Tax=Rhododendron griersonianum TaxID=479676 RepID=A0AAV6LFH1_9ERIC|nr:hypothetical protein RHGRI_006092 [Rhododendron griersonianum]